jgi:hypothetical protein
MEKGTLDGFDIKELARDPSSLLLVIERRIYQARMNRVMSPALIEQLERACEQAGYNYSGKFENDAEALKIILDRLEVVESAMGKAEETIRSIDWAS